MSQSPDQPDSSPGSGLRRPAEPHRRWSEGVAATPSPGVQATMHEMSERLQSVIDAAERGAEAIRSDAEEQARMHVAAAQRKADRMTAERVRMIAELTDDLITRAETARTRSEEMIRALECAIGSVAGRLAEPGLAARFSIDEAVSSPHIPPAPAPAAPPDRWYDDNRPPAPPPGTAPVSEEALMHATRLAVAGQGRAAIARALREEFGVAVPGPTVDRVLGPT